MSIKETQAVSIKSYQHGVDALEAGWTRAFFVAFVCYHFGVEILHYFLFLFVKLGMVKLEGWVYLNFGLFYLFALEVNGFSFHG